MLAERTGVVLGMFQPGPVCQILLELYFVCVWEFSKRRTNMTVLFLIMFFTPSWPNPALPAADEDVPSVTAHGAGGVLTQPRWRPPQSFVCDCWGSGSRSQTLQERNCAQGHKTPCRCSSWMRSSECSRAKTNSDRQKKNITKAGKLYPGLFQLQLQWVVLKESLWLTSYERVLARHQSSSICLMEFALGTPKLVERCTLFTLATAWFPALREESVLTFTCFHLPLFFFWSHSASLFILTRLPPFPDDRPWLGEPAWRRSWAEFEPSSAPCASQPAAAPQRTARCFAMTCHPLDRTHWVKDRCVKFVCEN